MRQVQRQVLRQNQRQIQLARLLEVPIEELDKHINQEIEKNDALEIAEEGEDSFISLPEASILVRVGSYGGEGSEDTLPAETFSTGHTSSEEEDYYGPYNFSVAQTLYESLLQQLSGLSLTERERAIAEYLIGNLNERGLLTESLAKLARLFSLDPQGFPVTEAEMSAVLEKLQMLDPPGIGARSLQEVLYLQARALPDDDPHKPYLLRLLGEDFPLFAQRRFDRLKARYQLSEEAWSALIEKLRTFSLAPGAALSEEAAPQVQPDFILHIESDGTLRVELTRWYAPRLRTRVSYKRLLEEYSRRKKIDPEQAEVLRHIRERVERAEQFIQLLHQREQTLLRTAEEIVRQQRAFFLSGCDERQLRPLVLREVAAVVKVDISTVSRVVNSKYIETPCGIYPLKFFFSEGISAQDGKKVSNKAVKRLLRDLIANEPQDAPYSDEKLVELLQAQGIQIKRRTVAKYREQLGIPSARERKRIP